MQPLRVALLPLLALTLVAQDRPASDPSVARRLQADIAWLAGPETQGRGHGSEGLERTARFLEARHRALKLRPQVQRFEAKGPLRATRHEVALKGVPLAWGTEVQALRGGEVHLQAAPALWLGLGRELPESLAGRVAVLLEGGAEAVKAAFPAGDASLAARAAAVAKRHPAALVIVPRPGSEELVRLSALGLPGPDQPFTLTLTEAALEKVLGSLDAAPRDLGPMELQVTHTSASVSLPNVISVIPGRDPQLRDEYLVLSAHFDHLGTEGGVFSRAQGADKAKAHPGADDNASGTAMVLDLGRRLARKPTRRSILLLQVSGEEQGLLGSAHWAANPTIPLAKVKAGFNFDMVGRMDPAKPRLDIGTLAMRPQAVARLDAHVPKGLPVSHDLGFTLLASDHASLFPKRIPVAFYTTGLHPQYHTPEDTADRINAKGAAQVEEAALAAIREFGDADTLDAFDPDAFQALFPPPAKAMKAVFGALGGDAEDPRGLVLEGVREGSPAEALGLKAGDVLVSFDGKEVRALFDLNAAVAGRQAGDKVRIVWFRGAERMEGEAVLKGR